MRYIVIDETEYAYPDVEAYESASDKIDLISAKGSYACAQVLLYDLPANGRVNVRLEGLTGELFSLLAIPVETNAGMAEGGELPHCPERKAPFEVYDCLKPYDGILPVEDGKGGLYVSIPVAKDAEAGVKEGVLTVGDVKIPITLKVYDVTVPEETLKVIQGFGAAATAKLMGMDHKSEEFRPIYRAYLKAMRRMRQNMMYTGGVPVTKNEDGTYSYDFEGYEASIREQMECGMKYFTAGCIGGRKSWKESTIYVQGMPGMSYEAYCFMSDYLPKLQSFLEERGWLDIFCLEICDEPNDANATEFRALCGLAHRLAPKIRLMDACSYGELHGSLDIWVPLNSEYQKHRKEIETFRTNGAEIWHYVCCGPRGEGFINRFMDCPLLCPRYLFWGNYAYNLTGYLHWAAAAYQPNQDPFVTSCPEHHNADAVCFLPSGDTHLLYPGANGPWMSIRAEAQRAGVEDYELLRALQAKDAAKADAVCASVFTSFNEVNYSVKAFKEAKKALLEALEA